MTLGLQDTIGQIQPLCQFSGVKTPGMTENDYRIAWYGPQKGSDTHEPQDPRKVEKDPARARLWRFSLAKAIRKRQVSLFRATSFSSHYCHNNVQVQHQHQLAVRA